MRVGLLEKYDLVMSVFGCLTECNCVLRKGSYTAKSCPNRSGLFSLKKRNDLIQVPFCNKFLTLFS